MNNIVNNVEFPHRKRESLLDYNYYSRIFSSIKKRAAILEKAFHRTEEEIKKIPLINLSNSTQQRAWDALNQMTLFYSAGHEIDELRDFYAVVLEWWEKYSKYDTAYDLSPESENAEVAQLPLLGPGYEQANRLLCFGVLLGKADLIPRLIPILDYNNPKRDGMLERLIGFYIPDRGVPPDECTRHLPYFKTLKIFDAPQENRPALMAKYLEDWYHASRREPYHDSHDRGVNFFGYWSWESAAITFLLNIDDTIYRDAQFYPKDLVEFARSLPERSTVSSVSSVSSLTDEELRATAGQPCPKAGQWETLDIPPQTKFHEQDEVMLDLKSVYGLTVWRRIGD
ncbi:DUF1911 domain-containing protein [Oxalobacteraceae bacterium]|nr:DUF1911 domain-containing protein [Oxalobacteraceae bacterium]